MKAKRKIAALFFFCGLLSSRPTCAGNSPASPARTVDAAIPRSIPLRIFRDYLVVAEGQFGDGMPHQNFVLDTGTAPSIIDTKSVRELGLATTASTMAAMGKIIPTDIAVLPKLDLGPIQAVSLRVQVQDLSRLERDLGIPVAGIIGLDVLSKSSFRLDYEKKQMEFGQVSDEGIPVSFDERTGTAVALASIEGIPARLLVDTGSDRVAVLGRNLPETKRLALRTTTAEGLERRRSKYGGTGIFRARYCRWRKTLHPGQSLLHSRRFIPSVRRHPGRARTGISCHCLRSGTCRDLPAEIA